MELFAAHSSVYLTLVFMNAQNLHFTFQKLQYIMINLRVFLCVQSLNFENYFLSVSDAILQQICITAGLNAAFEFRRQHECIKLLENHKRQKISQTDRSSVFFDMFSLDEYALLLKMSFVFRHILLSKNYAICN